jgi:hypothetical protein
MPTLEKTQAEIWIEKAKFARQQRKSAPPIDVRGFAMIPQKSMIEKYAKETGGQNAPKGFHFMFGDRKLGDNYADQGYEPVLENGKHVHVEGDPLWKIPTSLYQADLSGVKARSDFLLKARVKEDAAAVKASGTTGNEEYERKTVSAEELAMVPAGG